MYSNNPKERRARWMQRHYFRLEWQKKNPKDQRLQPFRVQVKTTMKKKPLSEHHEMAQLHFDFGEQIMRNLIDTFCSRSIDGLEFWKINGFDYPKKSSHSERLLSRPTRTDGQLWTLTIDIFQS